MMLESTSQSPPIGSTSIVTDSKSTSLSGTQTESFTRFPQLPADIRQKIWRNACFNNTRNIVIWKEPIEYDMDGQFFAFGTKSVPPAVLHTCREGRAEGLKHYKLEFGVDLHLQELNSNGIHTFSTLPTSYINWKVDRLVMFDHNVLMELEYEDRGPSYSLSYLQHKCRDNGLVYLAMSIFREGQTSPYLEFFGDVYPWGGKVEELIIYDGTHISGRERERVKPRLPGNSFDDLPAYDDLDCGTTRTGKRLSKRLNKEFNTHGGDKEYLEDDGGLITRPTPTPITRVLLRKRRYKYDDTEYPSDSTMSESDMRESLYV